ncbi:alpha/beta hydrolase family protein [Micromonospora coxensis]|uniref:Predicted alpha/beta hydrolase n=1 Tax=Micromonospora coxensis TaxID=356852 RepID=A0A1C5JQE4_9ACTN|nr:alpha/beta fold hydrolase [Micromonospora coxensis]SCG72561.1 Predicted alpha/beta hydrolase [Micromonospora coxensis]
MSGEPEYTQEHVEVDGARIGVQVYPEPDGPPGAPMVVIWPAMGVRARYYRPFAAALRDAGLAVAVADLRGTGASTPPPGRACRYGYAELATDVGAVLDALKPRLDGRTRLLLGHSLGGQAALLHLAVHGADAVDGLALLTVGVPYWRSYPGLRGYGVLPYTQGIAAVARTLGVWPGWGFGGRQARGVIRDWAYTARTGRFPVLDGVDAEAAVRRLTTPVLAVGVDDDQYTPHATLDHLCAKLTAAPVTRDRYTVAEAGAPLDHFTWVRAGAPLARRVADFAAGLPPR